MSPVTVDLAIAAVSLALFAAAFGGALLATRPARPASGPATPDLGDEPPAVVNMLANRWRPTSDAAEATLLDLAARRLIALRQPANDPAHTTIHMRDTQIPPLLPYEVRVWSRIRGLAVDGMVPVTALTFRDQSQAKSWNRQLRREVVADARERGLSRRRFGGRMVAGLVAVAAVSAAGLFLAVLRAELRAEDSDIGGAFSVGVFSLILLVAIANSQRGERDTMAGRAAAARWLGVRDWLRGHEEFAALPPAAVAVWDRYLPYGAALGVTHTTSAVLDLGMGDRRLLWSSYGNRWRRVRVRYPRFRSRYGHTVPSLAVPAVLSAAVGGLLIGVHDLPAERNLPDLGTVAMVLGVLLIVRGAYRAARATADLATTRTITGQVLWVEVWRSRKERKQQRSVPWLHYLAVDDGQSDLTTAWALPHRGTSRRCQDGDTVTIQVRPWSRRVVALTVGTGGRVDRGLSDAPVVTDRPGAPAR